MDITFNTNVTSGGSALSFTWGWDEAADNGTTFDWYVDQVSGSDSNAGTSSGAAFATIAKANTVLSAGDTVGIMGDGVKYRVEMEVVSGSAGAGKTQYIGYSTHRPIITAADSVTGWSVVSNNATEQARLGTTLAAAGTVYKKASVAKTTFPDDHPWAANMFEADTRLELCRLWANNKGATDYFYLSQSADWLVPDSVQTSGSNITGYTLSTLSTYTSDQMLNSLIMGTAAPLVWYVSEISTFTSGTGAIVLSDTSNTYQTPTSVSDNFSIYNLLPAMEQGTWGWWDNGDGTVDLYVYPNSSVELTTNGAEYTTRGQCLVMNQRDYVKLSGLEFRQAGGKWTSTRNGIAIATWNDGSGIYTSNLEIDNCRVSGCLTGRRAAIEYYVTTDWKLHNTNIENIQLGFGFFAAGQSDNIDGSATLQNEGGDCQFNKIVKSEDSPFRFFATWDCVWAFNYAEGCGLATHGNKSNFYEQSHACLGWGIVYKNCGGYYTWQRSSGISMCFSIIPPDHRATSGTSRNIVDQNGYSGEVRPIDYAGYSIDSYMFNNILPPAGVAVGGTAQNSVELGVTDTSHNNILWHFMNNIYHGHFVPNASQISTWTDNQTTQTTQGTYNGNDTAVAATSMYTDPANDDWTIKTGAAVRSTTGADLTSKIAALKAQFDDRFDGWNTDALGNYVDYSAPPVGPVSDYDLSSVVP